MQPAVAQPIEIDVHADLADAAQRDEAELVRHVTEGCLDASGRASRFSSIHLEQPGHREVAVDMLDHGCSA